MKYVVGMDVSTLLECEQDGAKYYDHGEEKELMHILKDYGTNSIRLRLWLDPYDENGVPYGGGTCDIEHVITLAKRAKSLGLSFLLDIHYSDFWVDPYKQTVPKAWKNYSFDELVSVMYTYTTEVLNRLKSEGVTPDMIQVGNEITYGMLWPQGKIEKKSWKDYGADEYDDFCTLLKSGIKAVRDFDPSIPIIIHLERSFDNDYYRFFFNEMKLHDVDYDAIGLSYYPYWHFSFNLVIHNMIDMYNTFHKDLYIVETAYAFTTKHYTDRWDAKPLAVNSEYIPSSNYTVEFPLTPEGQKEFFTQLLLRLSEIEGFKGIYYWEPAWLPTPHSTWASEGALRYMELIDKMGNEWCNQALFDYDGNALPALEVFRDFSKKYNS